MASSSSSNSMPLNEKLLKLMESENRPYTFNDIHDRIGKEYPKQVVEKCIDNHVANKRFIEKISGKLKIFCFSNKLNEISIETVSDFKLFLSFCSPTVQTKSKQFHVDSKSRTSERSMRRSGNTQNQLARSKSALNSSNRFWKKVPTRFRSPFFRHSTTH